MKVKFLPSGEEFDITPDQSVMELAHEKGIFIKSICNGLPSCAECRVRVSEGDANVLPPNAKELNLIGTGYFIDQRRLSCQLRCYGDVSVDLTEQVAKKDQTEHRTPVGLKNTDSKETHSVSGNLIQQEESMKDIMAEAEPEPSGQKRFSSRREHRSKSDRSRSSKKYQKQAGGDKTRESSKKPSRSRRSFRFHPNKK